MPYAYTLKRSPKGHEYVEAISTGTIDLESANDFTSRFRKGGIYGGKALLAFMTEGTRFTVEGRKALTAGTADTSLIAVVVTSAALRVMLNFMIKAGAAITSGSTPMFNLRTFTQHDEALAWLDDELNKKAG